jgi:hypothetical protein
MIGGWHFARGKENEQTLSDVVVAGALQIALPGADGLFAPGDILFISEADGSETEFLGGVTGVTASRVSFALPVRRSKNSGARLWRAEDHLGLSAQCVEPLVRRLDPGVVVLRSVSGGIYSVRVAEPGEETKLKLVGITPQSEAQWLDWLLGATQGGLASFTLVRPDRSPAAVRLAERPILRERRSGAAAAMTIELIIEAEETYA